MLLETSVTRRTVRSVDVSGGGIAISTDLNLAPGDRVDLYFELPIGFAVETQAEVVRRENAMIALRFVDAPAQQVLAVRSFCSISAIRNAQRA